MLSYQYGPAHGNAWISVEMPVYWQKWVHYRNSQEADPHLGDAEVHISN